MKSAVVSLVLLLSACAHAVTWHVDRENGDDSAAVNDPTGGTPFATIQKAVERAADGETVLVGPGVYDEGNGDPPGNGGWGASRVGWANKKIILKSTHGPDVTHITGVRSKDTELGIGSGAVRCLAFKSDNGAGAGSVVEGFTLRDGATVNDGAVGYKAWGGAFYSNSHELYVIGCVISNCVAYESGVCANGTLYRCLVDGNSVRSGQYLVRSSNGARTRLYSSVFTRNSTEKDGIMLYNVDAVGCTFIGNRFGSCTYNATGNAYNCVFLGTGALHASFGYENCVSSGRPVMSPLLGDWRALSIGSAAGMGDADHVSRMSLPEGYEAADFYGNAIQGAATLAAGASAFPVTPEGGCVSSAVSSGMKIDGCPVFMNAALNYVYADTYPTQYRFTVDSQAGKRVCRYNFSKITDLVDKTAVRFPDMDDGLWVMPPPSGHELVHESVTMSSSLIWVEPDADAESADGSEENPYRTIKVAIAAAGANAVICCREGTYAEGESSDGAVLNRVLFPSDVTMRLIGVGGAEKTVILGSSDGSAGSEYGLGPDAVRCVRGRGLQQVQGFTLTGGRTTATEYGGAVRSGGTDLFVSDCIITNNAAAEGAAVYGARLQRCVIADNSASGHFVLSTAPMSSCVVFSNKVQSANSYGYVGYSSPAYNTTFLLPETDSPFLTWGTGPMYNCIVSHASSVPSSIKVSGCVFWNVKTLSPSGDHIEADPYFADESAGDVRPFGASPVFSSPEIPTSANYGKEYWFWVSTDLDGIPFTRLNGGRPFAGAYGTPSQKHAVIVKSPLGGLSVAEGVLTMEEGSTVIISPERGSRPCVGVSVGGEISYFRDGSVTVPYSSSSGGMIVEALYTNVWYAAVDGNDSAAGSFPGAALTLQGALSNPDIESGDRVLALPGEYSVGEMAQGDGFDVKARVVVPAGVTLESVEGNALTTIKGRAASVPDDPTTAGWDVRGMGADAVRCVYLNSGSRVKGFTLTDGFTRVRKGGTVVDHEGADTTGGGVYAGSGYTYPAWVEDCVITNCAAYRGGGVKRANVLRCVLTDNYSLYFGSAASDCACYETLTKNNECPNGAMNAGISYWSKVEGCTVLDALGDGASAEAIVANTLVKGYFMAGTVPSGNIRNCAVNKDMRLAPSADAFAAAPGTLLVDSSALEVDRYGRPVIGGNVAVDAGDPLLSSYASETDLSGMQRIYNALPDIGALEADWRPRYAKDIGARGITVAAASATVTESPEGLVRLNPGAVLDAVWTLPSATGRRLRSVSVSVSGDGEIAVGYNGIVIGTVSAADGTASVPFKDDLAVNSLTFAYSGSGYAEILGVENEAGMKVIIR